MQSHIDLNTLNANSGNDSWGWTDPVDGKEYAIMGLNNGTAFIDVSQPETPIYLGKLPTHTTNSSWRDIKFITIMLLLLAKLVVTVCKFLI